MLYDEAWSIARRRIAAGEPKREVYRSEGKIVFDKATNKNEQQCVYVCFRLDACMYVRKSK